MALKDKYVVRLTPEQRQHLEQLVSTGSHAAATLSHARLLLKADMAHGAGWPAQQIAEALEVSGPTVARIRQCFGQRGLKGALPPPAAHWTAVAQAGWCPRGAADRASLQPTAAGAGALDLETASRQAGGVAGGVGYRPGHGVPNT